MLFCPIILLQLTIVGCTRQAEEEKKPVQLSASVGQSAVFTCDLDFPQDVVIPYILNWNKQGERLASLQDGTLLFARDGYAGRVSAVVRDGRAHLNLSAVREPDQGWYECRLFFPNRTPTTRLNGTWFYLTVHGSDLLGVPPINKTVVEGDDATLECISKDSTARVTWYKDDVQLRSVPGLEGRAWSSPEGSLTVSNTRPEDIGHYKCEVVATTGQTQSATAYLNVHYKARVVFTLKEVFLPIGRPGHLDCHYMANPPLTKLRWEKDGFLFDPFNVPSAFSRRNGSLYFSKVEESHGGEYTCTPNNELGTMGPSPPIHVVVQHAPVFTVTPHNMYMRKPGDTIHMACDALDGDTRPTIVWFKKDGSPLPQDRAEITGGNLTIKAIQESDRGLYQCVASNEAATISADTELLIENSLPRGPHNLTGEAGSTSVTLTWRPGVMANSAQYSVWVRSWDSQEWRTVRATGSTATISSLRPGHEYEFMVLSQNEDGDGMFSKPIRLVTKGPTEEGSTAGSHRSMNRLMKTGPPRNFSVTGSDEGFKLSWEPPASGTEGLDHYKVEWEEGLVPIAETTQDTSHSVGPLKEGTYFFKVKAVSSDGLESAGVHFILQVVTAGTTTQAVALGLSALVGFIIAALLMFIYINRVSVHNRIGRFTFAR